MFLSFCWKKSLTSSFRAFVAHWNHWVVSFLTWCIMRLFLCCGDISFRSSHIGRYGLWSGRWGPRMYRRFSFCFVAFSSLSLAATVAFVCLVRVITSVTSFSSSPIKLSALPTRPILSWRYINALTIPITPCFWRTKYIAVRPWVLWSISFRTGRLCTPVALTPCRRRVSSLSPSPTHVCCVGLRLVVLGSRYCSGEARGTRHVLVGRVSFRFPFVLVLPHFLCGPPLGLCLVESQCA